MENVEKPLENSGKTGKPPRRDRVARCVCTNEWTAHNGNEEKPSRCPVCKSRDVKWRDECADEEFGNTGKSLEFQNSSLENQNSSLENQNSSLENQNSTDGKMEFQLEKVENPSEPKPSIKTPVIPPVENGGKDDLENQTLEDIQKNFTGIPALPLILFMGIIGVFGLIWFLVGQAKNRRRLPQKIPYPVEYQTEMRRRSHTQGRAY